MSLPEAALVPSPGRPNIVDVQQREEEVWLHIPVPEQRIAPAVIPDGKRLHLVLGYRTPPSHEVYYRGIAEPSVELERSVAVVDLEEGTYTSTALPGLPPEDTYYMIGYSCPVILDGKGYIVALTIGPSIALLVYDPRELRVVDAPVSQLIIYATIVFSTLPVALHYLDGLFYYEAVDSLLVLRYSPGTLELVDTVQKPFPFYSGPQSEIVDGKICFFDGVRYPQEYLQGYAVSLQPMGQILCYDPDTGTWSSARNKYPRHYGAALKVLENAVLHIGGTAMPVTGAGPAGAVSPQ